MLILKYLFKFLKVLNSNEAPGQIALGMAFGLVLGLIPVSTLHWWLLLIIMYTVKANLATGTVFIVLFKLLGTALGSVFDSIGYAILTFPGLEGFFTNLYNTPILPFTRYYNTVVISTTLAAVILFVPMIFISRALVKAYRTGIRDRLAETKVFKAVMKVPVVSKLVKLYGKVTAVKEAM